jgi:hypothetical protein
VQIGAGHWLRIPLGNHRWVPLHPELVQLLAAWAAASLEHIRRHRRLIADHRGLLDRYVIGRIVARVGRAADVTGVHPRRLRHTLATRAINRGMRLEAIAALLGHRTMEMTLIYARIANQVIADEYAAVTAKIDALYVPPPELPADYFRTSTEFLPILTRQRDHGQTERAALFIELIRRVDARADPLTTITRITPITRSGRAAARTGRRRTDHPDPSACGRPFGRPA